MGGHILELINITTFYFAFWHSFQRIYIVEENFSGKNFCALVMMLKKPFENEPICILLTLTNIIDIIGYAYRIGN